MGERASMSSLSPGGPHSLMRNRSQQRQNDRLTSLKRGSMRGIQTLFSAQNGVSPYSSNSSVDGRISPSPSFATSHDVSLVLRLYSDVRTDCFATGLHWIQ